MDKFFANAAGTTKAADGKASSAEDKSPSKLPKGVVLGKDGKPCRTCTSTRDWLAMVRAESAPSKSSSAVAAATATVAAPPAFAKDCPPDVERLGRHTWTLLHSMTGSYPVQASQQQQRDMGTFLGLFAKLYPCWVCAEDFDAWMASPTGQPRLRGRDEFGTWMCEAHNEVNRKLGKAEFDCSRWQERWRDGWRDGSCE